MRISVGLLAVASISLLATATPALATEPTIEEVLDAVEQDAVAEPAIPEGVEQDYAPNPAIWRLADEDTTIYLFGTIHILPPGFAWRSAQFDAIVGEVDELVLETSDADAEAEMDAMLPAMIGKMLIREPTSTRLSPENGKKFLKLGQMAGMPPDEFDNMPVILSMIGLGLNLSMMEGSTDQFGVETVLSAEFARMAKPVGSIENSGEVMLALLDIDEQTIVSAVEADLELWDGKSIDTLVLESSSGEDLSDLSAVPFAMEHEWARGEVSDTPMFDDSALGLAMHKVLLEDRNRAWAGWLDQRLDKPGTILVAVGAGHFEGRDSVLEMLEQRGLSATRIN